MTRADLRGKVAYQAGAAAEHQVARLYEDQGYETLVMRWRGSGGEIDLILRKAELIVFVEVKKSRSIAQAAERITPHQVARIGRAAEEFMAIKYEGQLLDMRFDAALVDTHGEIEIVENAF